MMIQIMMKVTSLALTLGTTTAFSTIPSSKQTEAAAAAVAATTTKALSMAAFSPDENDSEDQPRLRRQAGAAMSKAIPFLRCPELLVDCRYAGNVGFDPLGLAKNEDTLIEYRESEIKHGRLAMLAAVGWPVSEIWDRAIASHFEIDPVVDVTARAPSLLNGGLDRVSPIWWGFCLGLSASIDLYGLAKARRGDTGYEPGMLGFDPFGLYPETREGQEWMKDAEIKHGRLAMLVVVLYSWVEFVSQKSLVDETTMLLEPLKDSAEYLQMEAALLSPLVDAL